MHILNTKEMIKYLNCSDSLLRKLIREHQIEYFKIGSKICFEQEKVDNWINEQYEKWY